MPQPLAQQDVYDDNERLDVSPHIPRQARSALDVGCGKGGFGPTLRRALGPTARIVAIEPVASQAAHARVDHGFDEVLEGYFPEALGDSDDRFDLITFNDVLEHLLEPQVALRHASTRLAPGGVILAAIPMITYAPAVWDLLRGNWTYTDHGILDRTHVRFFTKSSLAALYEDAGLEITESAPANSVWELDWARKRTWKRRLWLLRFPEHEWLHRIVTARPMTKPHVV